MGSVSNFVQSVITSATRSPSQTGFGTPLLAANFNAPAGPQLVYEYDTATALDDMVADGFSASGTPYKMMKRLVSQSPCPPKAKIGRLASGTFSYGFTILVTDATVGRKISLTVNGTTCTHTVTSGQSTTDVATDLGALLNVLPGFVTNTDGNGILLTGAATPLNITDWTRGALSLLGTDAYSDLTGSLNAINEEDSDWFGYSIESVGANANFEAADWADSHTYKTFFASTSDTECGNPDSTSDIMWGLKDSSYLHTYIEYNGRSTQAWGGIAEMSTCLANLPGSYTGAFKTHIGTPADTQKTLSAGQRSAILAKNGNVYESVAGLGVTSDGKVPFGEYLDVVIFRDWVNSQIQTRVFGAMANALKVPYTDPGTQVLASQVRSVMTDGVTVGGFAANPAPVVAVAKVAAQSDSDRANRRFPGITWSATLAGAIHFTRIGGTIGV